MPNNGSKSIATVSNPTDLYWVEGELPPADSVPPESRILCWIVTHITQEDIEKYKCVNEPIGLEHQGMLRSVEVVMPRHDSVHGWRWCEMSGHPIGYHERVAWYAWIAFGDLKGFEKELDQIDEESLPD